MKPKLFRVLLPVTDIDRAAQFYAVVLGASYQHRDTSIYTHIVLDPHEEPADVFGF